ncbi:MAG: DNA primase TraC [Acinetobacter bereziniae]|uniref:DNA primase TraC n=1 Tax=Acinetobacter bereziniae TaxID=106648 RepID=A0A833PI20_ACIBZ|nr:MAG: DNA primase TraC [Acinetobacter bereziniae]
MKKEYVEELSARLIEQIKSNTAPWQKPWKPGEINTALPRNVITGKPYRGMNLINLMSKAYVQGYDDPRWLSAKQGNDKFDAYVRKGEKGTLIHYWKFTDERQKKDENGKPVIDENGKPVKEVVRLDKPQVFFSVVFNAQQFEGMPPIEKTIKPIEEWERHQLAENILNNSGVPIRNVNGDRAYYNVGTDQITMPERSQFDSSDKYYATALHELGHATGHPSRLKRDLTGGFGSENYAKEELRAEIASMMLGQELQIGHDPSQHVAYLQSWVKVLEEDPKEIFRATRDADKIMDYVLELNRQKTIENTQEFLQKLDQNKQTELTPSLAYESLQQLAKDENLEIQPITMPGKLIVKLTVDTAKNLSVNAVFGEDGHIALHDLEDKPLITAFNSNDDFKVFSTQIIRGIKDTIIERENRTEIVQDPDVIAHLQQLHEKIKATSGNKTAFDMYEIVSKHAENMGYTPIITERPLRNEEDSHNGYRVNLYDGNRKTDVGADIMGANTLVCLGEKSVHGSWINDKAWIEENLSKALFQDFVDQVALTVDKPTQENKDSLLVTSAHKIALFNAKTDYFQFEAGPTFKEQIVNSLKEQNLADEEFIGIALPFNSNGGHVVVSQSAKEVGKFQVTVIGADNQPLSDFGQQTKEEALETFFNNVDFTETYNRFNEKPKKVYLDVPYHEKEQVKETGAKWDKKEKAWYVMSDQLDIVHNKWIRKDQPEQAQEQVKDAVQDQSKSAEKIFLTVDYKDKNEVKKLGAKWDKNEKSWYVPAGQDTAPFAKWIPESAIALDQTKVGVNMEKVLEKAKISLTVDNQPVVAAGQDYEAEVAKKTMLTVSFAEKDEVKKLGAKWDTKAKSWYVPAGQDTGPFEKWIPDQVAVVDVQSIAQDEVAKTNMIEKEKSVAIEPFVSDEKIYLAVAYEDRAEAKDAGAMWDAEVKCWYAPAGVDIQPFEKFLPENQPNVESNAHFTNLPDFQMNTDPVQQFALALRDAGLMVDKPKMDGQLYRVPVKGDEGGKLSGAYKAHLNGIMPAGFIQNYKTGDKFNWKAEGNFQGAVNTAKMIAEAAQRKQKQQQKQEQLYEEVADRAVALIEHAQPVSEQNKYLQAKQVESYGLLAVPGPSPEFEAMGIYIGNTYSETKALREKHAAMDDKDQYKVFMTKNDIMIPVSDQKGKVWTVQTIAENGFKSWLKGGKKHGNFFILGQPENGKPILEAEGYATGATLHKLTNRPVALAFDSGNLLSVAIAVKQMFDASTIYVAGDNDRAAFEAGKMKVNVGLEKALEAAQQVGGHTIIPNIQKGEKLSDWNDIAVTKGPAIAKDQIKTALESIKHEQSKVNEIKKTPTREENIPVKDKAQTPWNTEQKVRHRSM